MPPARLPERPKPPTGKQMLADIASADDNDVVFLTGQSLDLSGRRVPDTIVTESQSQMTQILMQQNLSNTSLTRQTLSGHKTECTDLTPTATAPEAGGESGDIAMTQAALDQAERRESAQRAYHKALELLDRVKALEDAPTRLESQFTRLSDLGEEMAKAIKDLQESSSHLTQNKKVHSVPKVSKTSKKKR